MATLEERRVREIEKLVTDWLHRERIPGASVVLVDEQGELYAQGFGARDLTSNAPATPDTLFGMGSVSKSVTALSVLQLAETGALSLEDEVDTYVDYFTDAPGEPITIAELLSHTSGMPGSGPGLLAQTLSGVPAGVADEEDRERWVKEATAHRVTDRDRFFYYNTGYDVLGRLISTVDGRPYPDYVREEVFEPLRLERATFDSGMLAADNDAMTPYRCGDDGPEEAPFPGDELIQPSGGLVAAPRELGTYLRAMLADGAVDGVRLCEPATVERLQRARTSRHRRIDGHKEAYGYGWMRQPLGDDHLVGHGGSMLVSTAYAGFLSDAGLGVVVACNTTPTLHPMDLGAAVLAVATGEEPNAVPAIALWECAESVAGTYESFRGEMTATVERDGGGLTVSIASPLGEQKVRAFPESLDPDDHTFYTISTRGEHVPLEFDIEGEQVDLFYTRNRLRRVGPAE